jgi:hypothetical protein
MTAAKEIYRKGLHNRVDCCEVELAGDEENDGLMVSKLAKPRVRRLAAWITTQHERKLAA